MNGDRIELRAFKSNMYFGVDFLMKQGNAVATDITFKEQEPNTHIDRLFHLGDEDVQLLMDDFWRAGFRPSEGTGSAGSLKATENHLNDMRKIVCKKLNVEL